MITSSRPSRAKSVLRPSKPAPFNAGQLPELNFAHISSMTDTTGIARFALVAEPRPEEGYSIDDNSAALLLTVRACKNKKNQIAQRLLPIYLGFIQQMQMDNGYFRNMPRDTKTGEEEKSTEDAFGRALMALGFLVNEGPTHLLMKTGLGIFSKAYPHIDKLVSLRSMASAIIGVCQVIKYNYPDDTRQDMVINLSNKLVNSYKENQRSDWHWYEPTLSRDNALLPLALLNAYEITQDEQYLDVALESIKFLELKIAHTGREVMTMILFYQQAFRVTREQQYQDSMYQRYQWFMGANNLNRPLYDPSTGGCTDGSQVRGKGLNQGAESTLSYWISHLAVASALAE
jgi:hypothetical protein